jgi:transposase-like protein
MADETVQTNDKRKGRNIDDSLKKGAVRKVIKLNRRGAIAEVANEVGVHPITLSDWMKSEKYNPDLKKNTKSVSKKSSVKTKPVIEKTSKPVIENGFSLREAIVNLPSDYDGLLMEHIKLLRKFYIKEKV